MYAVDAAEARVIASQAQVQSHKMALNGVREEARVGQLTVLDVLNAQRERLNARVTLVQAQRDQVIFSYDFVQAISRLTALLVATDTAKTRYDQVKELWCRVYNAGSR
jgi:outer membrane protein